MKDVQLGGWMNGWMDGSFFQFLFKNVDHPNGQPALNVDNVLNKEGFGAAQPDVPPSLPQPQRLQPSRSRSSGPKRDFQMCSV